jgi:MFS family permease
VAAKVRFADSARSRPGLVGAFFIDAVGTGMFLPFSLLFFLATTPLPLARIGLGLSVAAVVRIPATIAAGPLSDRIGPRAAIVMSQLLQAAGFAGYLFVHSFWQLVAAAVLVQIGNSIFWVAYAPLIFAISAEGEREHWFAFCTVLRTAGLAAGGVIAGATVALGGHGGYLGVAAANGASFVLAAFLSARLRTGSAAARPGTGPAAGAEGSWKPLLRDHAFLGFVAVNVGITFLALAIPLALPVFLVTTLGLPRWAPGAALALNATLVAASAPIVMSMITGRRRRNVLMVSQACMIVALAVFLLVRLLPAGAAIILVLVAILPLAACEVMQAAVVPAVVTESANPQDLGRYTSAYQVTFSIGDIIVPAIATAALHAGAAVLWLPLSAVAFADLVAVGLLARRMTALTQRVGQVPAASAIPPERLLEADGIGLGVRARREAAGRDGTPAVDGDAQQGLVLPDHGGAVVIPVGVFAGDTPVVLDETVECVGHVQDFRGPVNVNVGAVPVIGQDAERHSRIAAGIAGLRSRGVGGHHDPAVAVDPARHRRGLRAPVGSGGDDDAAVARPDEIQQCGKLDTVGGSGAGHESSCLR